MMFGGLTGTEAGNLATALRRRDPAVIELLIDRYQYRLMRYLLSLVDNRASAEDLFQETWIRVLEHGDQFDGRSEFAPWLFKIARNLLIDRMRRRKPSVSIEGMGEAALFEEKNAPSMQGALSQLDRVARQEERERIAAALAGIPVTHREVLALRFQEDMALEEIAKVVNAPVSTVKSRLYRGLEMLRARLEEFQQ